MVCRLLCIVYIDTHADVLPWYIAVVTSQHTQQIWLIDEEVKQPGCGYGYAITISISVMMLSIVTVFRHV